MIDFWLTNQNATDASFTFKGQKFFHNFVQIIDIVLCITVNMIIKLMIEPKYIFQKLLLIRLKRFNSFIATNFRFGFSFGSDFIFLKFELQFLDRILVWILALFFILDINTEKIIKKCAIFDSIFDFGFGF